MVRVKPARRPFLAFAFVSLMLLCPFSIVTGTVGVPPSMAPDAPGDAPMSGPAPMAAGDWPAFRYGADRTAVSNTEGPDIRTILWQNTTDDVQQGIYSSPAVAGGKVFFGSTNSKFYAYDAITGKQAWNNTTSSGDYGIDSSPAVSNGYVLIYVNEDDSLYSFNVSTGALRWKAALGASTAGGSSPIVVNGKVYVGAPNGRLYVRNENDGSAAWNFPMEGANQANGLGIISSPAVYNNTVFFGGGDKKFYAVNITTHNKAWSYALAQVGNPSPAVADGVVFYAEGAHTVTDCTGCGIYAFDVDGFADGNDGWAGESLTGATDGDIIWKKSMPNTTTSSPAVYGNYVYVGSMDNKFYALNRSNGNTIWSYDTNRDIVGSPSVADGKVFVADVNSKLYAFDIDGFADGNDGWQGEALTGATNGDIIWNYSMAGQVWGSPAISNGVLYLGNTQGKMFAIGTPTADGTPPQVLSTDPVGGAKNISLDKTVKARLSEALLPASVSGTNFTLVDGQSNPVAGVVSYQPANFEMTFDPASNLKPHETYTATILNIKDLFNNPISNPHVWSFTTINGKPTLGQGTVTPASGSLTTTFQYKVLYTEPDNDSPAGSVRVHIDGNVTGKAMIVNISGTPAALHDGNFANGEAYIYNTTFSSAGTHDYQFRVTDGFDLNITQKFTGPQVSALNGPPVIGAVPDQSVTEDMPYTFDLGPYISDPDNATSQLKMNVTFQYLTGTAGFNATFLFPATAPATSNIIFTVSDGINKVTRSVRFIMTYVDDAPVLAPLEDVTVNASKPFKIDLAAKITDIDTPLSGITVTTNSSFIVVSGLNLTLNYPRTVSKELVNVSVKDATTTVYGTFWVTVIAPPLNKPPTIDTLPDATPTEDVALDYDLNSKVHDDGLPTITIMIKLIKPSPYVSFNGPFLRLLYPNGVLSDTVNFTVSDGEFNVSGQLKVKVTPVNDPPVLTDYKIIPSKKVGKGGSDTYLFLFSVVYTDVDSPSPVVELMIDGVPHTMEKTAGTYNKGMTFNFSIWDKDLKKGTHTYRFRANDSSGAANAAVQTPEASFEVTTPKTVNKGFLSGLLPFLLIIIVVIVVIAVVVALMLRRKKGQGQPVQPQGQPQQVNLMTAAPPPALLTPQVEYPDQTTMAPPAEAAPLSPEPGPQNLPPPPGV